ncbi:unnamed protein product [Schistosoma turkestanicum]|nr:unnamed protein product [Schistosoma turkestanicum]
MKFESQEIANANPFSIIDLRLFNFIAHILLQQLSSSTPVRIKQSIEVIAVTLSHPYTLHGLSRPVTGPPLTLNVQ